MNTQRTIAFVDLAGFTALTEVHGDDTALDLVDTLTAAARNAATATDAELVKTIGDAVMLAAPHPGAGLGAVERVFEAAYASDAFPEPRAGLHHGPVIARGGDYFGATVNLAARVASRAGSGQAIGTATIATAAQAADLDTVPLGPTRLRNILEPVELFAIEICPTHVDLSVDPVCRMRLSCQTAVARIRHANTEHWLCSLDCARAFVTDPDRYLPAEGPDSP
ncbi:MAG TPA: adenylate/guanylate cyclase domain-containing protein [Acidimicrobiales bacterium]